MSPLIIRNSVLCGRTDTALTKESLSVKNPNFYILIRSFCALANFESCKIPIFYEPFIDFVCWIK